MQEFLELLFVLCVQLLLLDLAAIKVGQLANVDLHLICLGLQQTLLRFLKLEVGKLCITEVAYTILLFRVLIDAAFVVRALVTGALIAAPAVVPVEALELVEDGFAELAILFLVEVFLDVLFVIRLVG